jgi:hypothetical protein
VGGGWEEGLRVGRRGWGRGGEEGSEGVRD